MVSKTAKNGDHVVIPTDNTSCEIAGEKSNLNGDWFNICLLITLYTVQGFIIGFSTGLALILQSRKTVTYEDQAVFSITMWPFMMKILWAPLVDALYVQWIGRRKSWLIPLQLLMVTLMLYLANNIDRWIPESEKPNLKMLAMMVLALNFLAATQDIVVDGWSLTMLKKKNISYSSTCNNVGVSAGIFIGSVCFTLLVSEQFGNKLLFRKTPGSGGALLTMKSFLYIWIAVVSVVTFLVTVFKRERLRAKDEYKKKISVSQNYKLLWDVLRQPGIKVLAIALITTKIGFITTDSVSPLKLIDAGVSKDDIMIINAMMYLVKICMPSMVSKYVTSPNPMKIYVNTTPFKLFWDIAFTTLVYFTPSLIRNHHGTIDVPVYYYAILGFVFLINDMINSFMMVILFAFFSKISDPHFGGTYMTLFNTLYFIGWLVPNTLVLKLVDLLTFSKCSVDVQNFCNTPHSKDVCIASGGGCETYVDGYYIVMVICTIIGLVWYRVFRNIINKYQSLGLFSYKAHNLRLNTEQAYEN